MRNDVRENTDSENKRDASKLIVINDFKPYRQIINNMFIITSICCIEHSIKSKVKIVKEKHEPIAYVSMN